MTSISQKSANKDGNSSQKHGLAITDDVCTTSKPNGSYGKTLAARTETDRLSQLLEECNVVQNNIRAISRGYQFNHVISKISKIWYGLEIILHHDCCASEKSLLTEPYVSDCEMLRILRLPITGLILRLPLLASKPNMTVL
ncbi:hypothetical protein V6N11_035940 [Hibiscus sabdariffa]|uniref:Uncharacterized protein n=1 Tax=Hibiscus sabdariffa TaxID=183260 RepID=A0ABR2R8X3_9ROSI